MKPMFEDQNPDLDVSRRSALKKAAATGAGLLLVERFPASRATSRPVESLSGSKRRKRGFQSELLV